MNECESLNARIIDEMSAIFEYDELLEDWPKEDKANREIIKNVMKEQAGHLIEFRTLAIEKGCAEPQLWQDIENLLKIMEEKHEM